MTALSTDSHILRKAARLRKAIWPHPEYRGTHTRRFVTFILVFFGLQLIVQIALASVPEWRKAVAAMAVMAVYGMAELLLVRRVGITIKDDALTLHQLGQSRRVLWSKIEGFEWQVWCRVELLVVKLDSRRVVLATTIWTVKNYLSWLGSPTMRSKSGLEVDPLATLEGAWRSALQETP
jgi:hypothetical protein